MVSDEKNTQWLHVREELSQLCLEVKQMNLTLDKTIKSMHQESSQWRASIEDEFCRLITACTRQFSVMQEKYDRLSKKEAIIQRRLKDIYLEKQSLEEELKAFKKHVTETE